ncbi:hypothetical protein DL95DRAFT_460565 [Leptodontidium sp. 2 PMI_412]|nr:hypothetical protein DL95DRAFT_460565 [Leptodontidium sp. 2 PMI_412]
MAAPLNTSPSFPSLTGAQSGLQIRDLAFNSDGWAMEYGMKGEGRGLIINAAFPSSTSYTTIATAAVGYVPRSPEDKHMRNNVEYHTGQRRAIGTTRPRNIIPWDENAPPVPVVTPLALREGDAPFKLYALMNPRDGTCTPYTIDKQRVFIRWEFRSVVSNTRERMKEWSNTIADAVATHSGRMKMDLYGNVNDRASLNMGTAVPVPDERETGQALGNTVEEPAASSTRSLAQKEASVTARERKAEADLETFKNQRSELEAKTEAMKKAKEQLGADQKILNEGQKILLEERQALEVEKREMRSTLGRESAEIFDSVHNGIKRRREMDEDLEREAKRLRSGGKVLKDDSRAT